MPKKRRYRSISEQEEPSEEQVKQKSHICLRQHYREIFGRSKPIYAFINTIGCFSGNENPHMHVLTIIGSGKWRMRYAMDVICDLALTVRSKGIMDGGFQIGNQHIRVIPSEGSGDAICDIVNNHIGDQVHKGLWDR